MTVTLDDSDIRWEVLLRMISLNTQQFTRLITIKNFPRSYKEHFDLAPKHIPQTKKIYFIQKTMKIYRIKCMTSMSLIKIDEYYFKKYLYFNNLNSISENATK